MDQEVVRVVVNDREPVVHCAPLGHTNSLVGGDELAAAFESLAAHCPFGDGVSIAFGDEQSIGEPQEMAWRRHLNYVLGAREFLEEPLVAQSIHPHRLVLLVRHGDECFAAARRREAVVLFGDVEAMH